MMAARSTYRLATLRAQVSLLAAALTDRSLTPKSRPPRWRQALAAVDPATVFDTTNPVIATLVREVLAETQQHPSALINPTAHEQTLRANWLPKHVHSLPATCDLSEALLDAALASVKGKALSGIELFTDITPPASLEF